MSEKHMNIYEKNRAYIKKNYPYIEWEDAQIEQDENIVIQLDLEDNVVIGKRQDGHIWTFGSMYHSKKAAEYWTEQFTGVDYRTIFIVIGLGNGAYVKALHEKYPKQYIIVCEPDMQLFDAVMQVLDLEAILDPEILLAAGSNEIAIFTEYMKLINYDNKECVKYIWIPNYCKINAEQCKEHTQRYYNCIERLIIGRNTEIVDEKLRADNILPNLLVFPETYSIGQLEEGMRVYQPEKKVAIVVAAGPSLDKNVKFLKKAKNKAFIIVVDTALKTVINAGIIPDLAIMVDPAKDPSLFDRDIIRDLPLVVSFFGNYEVIKHHRGKLFFPTGELKLTEYMSKRFKKDITIMYSGGSVSNNAFAVVGLMRFKTIVLIGMDLAYPNGVVHTSDAYENEPMIDMSQSKYFEVEDVYGGKVYTEANMDAYRRWFEEQIIFNSEIRMIDATEGGAKIKGAEIMTLEDVIKEIEGLESTDYEHCIAQIPPLFSDEEQKEILEYYLSLEEKLDHLTADLKKQKKNYQDLEKKMKKRDDVRCQKIMKKITALTKKIESSELFDFARLYRNMIEYQVLDAMNDTRQPEITEEKKALRGGEAICCMYMENLNDVKKVWHNLLAEHQYL